ncbi:MAG: hypothetical protein K8T89_10055 [Planctomycetes bacterium]|nr:hypothetical protein [Planctomycetota bacterium]
MSTHLRVFPGLDEIDERELDGSDPAVRIRLGDLLPLVALAQKLHFIWLKDFLDDEVCISADLHDVLQAFRGVKAPSA